MATIASVPAAAPTRPDEPVAAIVPMDPSPEAGAPVSDTSAPASSVLVPYMGDARWPGRGPPPTDYSIFSVPETSPAPGYAVLDRDACEAELRRRGVEFARAEDSPGVRAPIRLTGDLHGVSIHSMLPAPARARSRGELIDCRLALSLDDFAGAMADRGITEVRTLSAYRTRSESGCTHKYPGEQHCAALAVDVGSFKRRDGKVLDVQRDFHGRIGTLTCRNGSHPVPDTPEADELWDIACTAAGKTFLVVLTPNWNSEHNNHFHLELTTHDWVLVR
ncbi:MAG: extensin family protein [Polyangiaceae bacterium]